MGCAGSKTEEKKTEEKVDPAKLEESAKLIQGLAAIQLKAANDKRVQDDIKLSKIVAMDGGKKRLKELFDTLDKDSNGKVTSKEWGAGVTKNKVLLANFFGGSTVGEIGKQFKRLDLDGSGDLTFDEFVSGALSLGGALKVAQGLETEEGKAELKALFDTIDKDGNGKVTSKEWGTAVGKNKEIMQKYFGGASPAEVGKAFKRLDADNSGDLTWDEFTKGAKALTNKKPDTLAA